MRRTVREGTGYPVYTNEDDAVTSHAAWDERAEERDHFGICQLIANALGYEVGDFYNAMRYHQWLHSGPHDDELPEDHWIREHRARAAHVKCPKFRYRITVEVEEIDD
jgi:hypothetical protein